MTLIPKTLLLRTCNADLRAHGGFQWPESGPVEAPDWNPEPVCGGGLHGLPWGEGDGSLVSWDPAARWLVWEAEGDLVDLGGKSKGPRGVVVHVGDRLSATTYLIEHVQGRAVVGATLTGGDGATLTGGYGSTLTGGDGATLTGGYGSTLTGGNYATLTGGNYATLTGGYGSTLTGGDGATLTGGNYATLTGGDGATLTGGNYATLTGGNYATLTGGYGSTLTGGDRATLTGGDRATLTGGNYATLTGGYGSTLTGGDGATLTGGDGATLTGGYGSTLVWTWWDGSRRRVKVGEVGDGGLTPGVAYTVDATGQVVPKAQP